MNNVDKINKFLKENDNHTLALPKVNEEVTIFYQMLMQRLCKKHNILFQKIESYKTWLVWKRTLFLKTKTPILSI